jgi:WD40 repeat protein
VTATDPELGLMLARRSAVLSPTQTAEDALRQALIASRLRGLIRVGTPLLAAADVDGAVVTAASDGSVLVVRHGSRRVVHTGQETKSASISGAGDVLLTGRDGRLRLVSGRSVRVVPGVTGARGAEISRGGQVAAVRFEGSRGSTSPKVQLVDLRSGRVVVEVDNGSPATAAAVSGGVTLLATGGTGSHVVRLWTIPDGRLVRTFVGHTGTITAIAFSTRGTLLATGATDGIGRVWRLSDGTPVSVLSGHINYLTDIAFSPDGTQVVTASLDRTARTWKAETGAALATCIGGSEAVSSAQFAGSGRSIVVASLDGNARMFDTVVQPELSLVADLGAPVTDVAYTRLGDGLTATSGGRSYRIPLPHGPAVETGPAGPVAAVITGPGGQQATIDGKDATITHADGTTVSLVGHKARITALSFSADGSMVVTASADHDGRVWDTRTGATVHVLRGHFAIVSGARFSPDGRWIVTAGPGTAGLWSTATGSLVYYLRGHTGKLLSAAFSPDGSRIATGGIDGTVREWRCTICGGVDELVGLADARLAATGREPTDEERQRYGL